MIFDILQLKGGIYAFELAIEGVQTKGYWMAEKELEIN